MKNLSRITRAIYESPWMILPSVHESIRKQLENVISGQTQLPQMQMEPDEMPEETPVDQKEEGQQIALIMVDGIIGKHLGMLETMCGGCDCDEIVGQLDAALSDPTVTTVMLYFNTPGGTVVGVPEVAEKITQVASKKRCVAYTDTLCASAGYYMASQCNEIYCAPSAELGSVGVYSIYLDESVALSNAGIKVNAISAGKFKLMGAPFKPMSDEERATLQADVDKIYNQFKSAVLSKRSIKDEDLQGQTFTGEDLITKGFVDGHINTLGEALDFVGQHIE